MKKKGGTVVHYAFGAVMGAGTVPPRKFALR